MLAPCPPWAQTFSPGTWDLEQHVASVQTLIKGSCILPCSATFSPGIWDLEQHVARKRTLINGSCILFLVPHSLPMLLPPCPMNPEVHFCIGVGAITRSAMTGVDAEASGLQVWMYLV